MKYLIVYSGKRGELYDPPCAISMQGDTVDIARANFDRIFGACFGDTLSYKIAAIIPEGSNATIYADPYNGVVV